MATCQYCGRELRCTGGYYYPVFDKCSCGGAERAQAENLRRCEEIQHQRETCSHSWVRTSQSGVGFERCTKCGANRPIGGGKW